MEDMQMTQSSKREEAMQMYAASLEGFYNSREGLLGEMDCRKCMNRGYTVAVNSDGFPVAYECECVRQRRFARQMRLNFGDKFRHLTFNAYIASEQWQQKAKDDALEYASQTQSNKWLFMAGQSGCGKTHLCTAICGGLVLGLRDVLYKRWAELLPEIDRTRFKDEQADIMGEIERADVLYIDDFLKKPGSANPTQSELFLAFRIIDLRYAKCKKTMISTEFFLSNIEEMDVALAGRIAEMAEGHIIQIKRDKGRNMRLRLREIAEHVETDGTQIKGDFWKPFITLTDDKTSR